MLWPVHRYQTTLVKLQQESGLSMEQLEQLATEEMLDNYIKNKCASGPSGLC